jgi:hypothetical protein
VLKWALGDRERASRQYVCKGWRLAVIWRKHSQEFCLGAISQQIFDRRLDIHSSGDRKLPPGRGYLAGRHAEMFEQRLLQLRLRVPEAAADVKGKNSHYVIIPVVLLSPQ